MYFLHMDDNLVSVKLFDLVLTTRVPSAGLEDQAMGMPVAQYEDTNTPPAARPAESLDNSFGPRQPYQSGLTFDTSTVVPYIM